MDDLVLFVFKHRRNSTQGIYFFANGIGIISESVSDFDSYFELVPKAPPIERFHKGILITSNNLRFDWNKWSIMKFQIYILTLPAGSRGRKE